MKLALALALSAIIAAPALARPGGTVALRHTARVGALRVTPLAVVEDSRCPENARCIWAGRATVSVRIARGHRSVMRRLTLGEPTATELGGVVLDAMSPEKRAGRVTPPRAYRFHFSPLAPD